MKKACHYSVNEHKGQGSVQPPGLKVYGVPVPAVTGQWGRRAGQEGSSGQCKGRECLVGITALDCAREGGGERLPVSVHGAVTN